MELSRLIEELSRPSAYAEMPFEVRICQTHISVVFLAGDFAYKIKKPVALSFLDFSTLEARRHFCQEEVRLNRRLAPGVYRGVVPVTRRGNGLYCGGEGEAVEWAVRMERLPEEATFLARLRRKRLDTGAVEGLARRLAAFHAAAEGSPHISSFATFDAIVSNACDALDVPGYEGDRSVLEHLRRQMQVILERARPLLESRAARGVPRDGHGDLRLEHIYSFPDKQQPEDWAIVDCIEFNERFRFADPVADAAFTVMDLKFEGRPDLADVFADAYFRVRGDDEGRALLPLYVAYRAAIRAKVEIIQGKESEIPALQRAALPRCAAAHWLFALAELEQTTQSLP